MAIKKKVQKNVQKTKDRVNQVFNQARESLKVLETLEKETLEKALRFVRMPETEVRKRLSNEKILASLKKVGVATQAEVDSLETRLASLENQLRELTAQTSGSKAAPTSRSKKSTTAEVEA